MKPEGEIVSVFGDFTFGPANEELVKTFELLHQKGLLKLSKEYEDAVREKKLLKNIKTKGGD